MKQARFLKIFLLIILFSSCKKQENLKDFTLKGFVFGTTYKITYLQASKNYQQQIDSLFLKMNQSLSNYLPTSDISKINKGDTTIVIDDYFLEVFNKSKRIYTETNGFFDPTVGNLVNAWGFGSKNQKLNLTDDEVVKQMDLVGLNKIVLENRKIIKENSEMYLDFNSIAKGYGIDVIARFLEGENIDNFLVEIGGEIRTKGFKEANKPWSIKLVDPLNSKENTGFKIINLSNKSMATSGNYRKFRIAENGKKYVHTINPKTGYATESNLLSASVIASLDCADVDAYATAFMAMGLEKTKEFLNKKNDLKVILIFTDSNGNLNEYSTYTYN